MSGWIKWYLDSRYNDMFREDWTAWHLFEYLCLSAYEGKPRGTLRTTRDKIGIALSGNSSTMWKALLRLEKAKMVTHSGTAKYTIITICNWEQFQNNEGQPQGQLKDSSRTAQGHFYKNKNKNKTIVSKDTNVEQVRRVYDLFILRFNKNPNTYKLSEKRKAKLKVRLRDAGEEMLSRAVNNVADHPFYRGDNDREWEADLDFIIRSYEQVERLAALNGDSKLKDLKEYT